MSAKLASTSGKWLALTRVADYIKVNGTSGIPIVELGELQTLVPDLIRDGALIQELGEVRFFHETLYDYVLARSWAESGVDLAASLIATNQDLSHRSLVRQVLTYQQGTDRVAYARSLRDLIFNANIRYHLKDVALSVLSSDPAPDLGAWSVVEHLIDTQEEWGDNAVIILSQQAWFTFADLNGAILRWAVDADAGVRQTIASVFSIVQRRDPDRVAIILSALLPVAPWRELLPRLISGAEIGGSFLYLELIASAIRAGIFDDGVKLTSEMFLYPVIRIDPTVADSKLRILGAFINRWYELAIRGGSELRDVLTRDSLISAFLTETGTSDPRGFLDVVLPATCQLLEQLFAHEESEYRKDPWAFIYQGSIHEADDLIFWTLVNAIQTVAATSPSRIRSFEKKLLRVDSAHSARFLLYSAWCSNPKRFCNRAAAYLIGNPAGLRCGYADSPYWVSRELVAAIHPFLQAKSRRALEQLILQYVPDWERSKQGRRQRGHAQFTLLSGINPRNLSDAAKRRVEELERKFGAQVNPPRPIEAGFVPSPIPADVTKLMTDAQWLRAMRKYSRDESTDLLKGGPRELSTALQAAARDNPNRFCRLAARLPPNIHEAYPSAILIGISDTITAEDAPVAFDAVRHIHSLPGRPCGQWIGRPLARLADCDIPSDVLAIVAWYAMNSEDPSQEVWKSTPEVPDGYYGGDPLTAGMNSVRGSAAQAVSALVWPMQARISFLLPALQALSSDAISSVRACAALAVLSLARHDSGLALRLFKQLTHHDEVRFLGTHYIERASMHFGQQRNSGLVPMIRRMLLADDPLASKSGGRQAMMMFLLHDMNSLAGSAYQAGLHARTGMAEVAAANIRSEALRDKCEIWLLAFFEDENSGVRRAAGQWLASDLELEGVSADFLVGFIDSEAFLDDPSGLLDRLDESVSASAEVVLRAVDRLIEHRSLDMADISTGLSADIGVMSRLVMRAYASATDARTRDRSLEFVDQMMKVPGSLMRQDVREYSD